MLINDNRVLKNGNNVFKAQVVESFIQTNTPVYNSLALQLSGVTNNNPLFVFYEVPANILKYKYTNDYGYNYVGFYGTNETSYKKIYFSGNLNSVNSLVFYDNNYFQYGYRYRGNLAKLLNQFPNLNEFNLSMNQYYYNVSNSNQSLSFTNFPSKLKIFKIVDNTLSGNINTITNFNKIENLFLIKCAVTGILSNINFVNLTDLNLVELYSLSGNLADILNNNTKLKFLYFQSNNLFNGNLSSTNVSGLTYIYLNIGQAPSIIGDISGWTFNTGLTQFNISSQFLTTDISGWDFSNTICTNIAINNNQYSNTNGYLKGSLSGWTLPNTLQNMIIDYVSGLTSIPQNYSNCSNFNQLYILECRDVANNLNNIVFNQNCGFIYFHNYAQGNLIGDIGTFVMPTGVTFMGINYNKLTGNIGALTLNSIIANFYLNHNLIYGEIVGMTFPDSLNTFQVGWNSGITVNFGLGVLNMNNVSSLYLNSISAITGSFANLKLTGATYGVYEFKIDGTPVHSDLSTLDPTKIYNLHANDCGT